VRANSDDGFLPYGTAGHKSSKASSPLQIDNLKGPAMFVSHVNYQGLRDQEPITFLKPHFQAAHAYVIQGVLAGRGKNPVISRWHSRAARKPSSSTAPPGSGCHNFPVYTVRTEIEASSSAQAELWSNRKPGAGPDVPRVWCSVAGPYRNPSSTGCLRNRQGSGPWWSCRWPDLPFVIA